MANPYMEDENPYMQVDKIQNTESFLQKAINAVGRDPLSGMSGGLPAIFGGANKAEDVVPGMTQFGTDFAMKATPQTRAASVIPGVKLGATVGATGLAEVGRQGVKALRGEGFNLGEAGKNTAITAGTEAIGRTGEQALFRSQIGKDLIGSAKKRLGSSLEKLFDVAKNNPSLQVAKQDFIKFLKESYDKIPFKIGPQASGMKKVIRTVEKDFPSTIGPKEVSATENMLGDIANFNPEKSGELKNKVANLEAKKSRNYSSKVLDDMAIKGGVPEVKHASKEAHLAQKFYPSKKKGIAEIISSKLRPVVIGGGAGLASQNPMVGGAFAMGDILLQSEPVQNFLYKTILKSGASKSARVGMSEVAKRNF